MLRSASGTEVPIPTKPLATITKNVSFITIESARIPPLTVKLSFGKVVPIPTFPDFKIITFVLPAMKVSADINVPVNIGLTIEDFWFNCICIEFVRPLRYENSVSFMIPVPILSAKIVSLILRFKTKLSITSARSAKCEVSGIAVSREYGMLSVILEIL